MFEQLAGQHALVAGQRESALSAGTNTMATLADWSDTVCGKHARDALHRYIPPAVSAMNPWR